MRRPTPLARSLRAAIRIAMILAVALPFSLPAQTTVFPGGSLADLQALSASGQVLLFDALEIGGPLTLSPADGEVVLYLNDLTVTASGSIGYSQSACSYDPPPDVRIEAAGAVVLDGSIKLTGKFGEPTSESTTCHQCQGVDGGHLSIRARDVTVNDVLWTDGGWGSNDRLQVGPNVFTYGCDAGDGGSIRLEATDWIALESDADTDVNGGEGGTGNQSNGADGEEGTVAWLSHAIDVAESEPNALLHRAQPLPGASHVVSGTVGQSDDAGERDLTIDFDDGFSDPLEDLFRLHFAEPGPLLLLLQAANPDADLDLYLIDGAATAILAESNGPAPSPEQIVSFPSSPADYLVGVTWCCGSALTSDFTLQVGETPPSPALPPSGLVERDLFLVGDGLVTRDAVLDLDWLDLTLTAGLSFDAVALGEGGWAGIGFRHATGAEVCSLLSRAATAPPACPGLFGTTVSADLLTPLQSVLRATRRTYSRVYSVGLYDDGGGGSVGRASLELSSGSSTVVVRNDLHEPALSDPFVGHFLVREVPPDPSLIFEDGFESGDLSAW
jgi:hypothetical protein